MTSDQCDRLRIEVNLRRLRAEAERQGGLRDHAERSASLTADIKSMLHARWHTAGSEVSVDHLDQGPAAKADLQVIEAILVMLGPLGLSSAVRLILDIIKTCRRNMPNSYEIEVFGYGSIRVSGRVRAKDLAALQDALAEMHRQQRTELYSATGKPLRITIREDGD